MTPRYLHRWLDKVDQETLALLKADANLNSDCGEGHSDRLLNRRVLGIGASCWRRFLLRGKVLMPDACRRAGCRGASALRVVVALLLLRFQRRPRCIDFVPTIAEFIDHSRPKCGTTDFTNSSPGAAADRQVRDAEYRRAGLR